MNADIKGLLAQLNKSYRYFEHKGKKMTKKEVKEVLLYGIKMGYEHTGQITDEETDIIINNFKKINHE